MWGLSVIWSESSDYPVNFVTGAIGNFFQSNKSNHNEVNQLKAKTKH